MSRTDNRTRLGRAWSRAAVTTAITLSNPASMMAQQPVSPAMKRVLMISAVGEAATGGALLIVPSLVGRLLLGVELSGVSVVIGRVTGIALVGLSIACWPARTAAPRGMFTYSALVMAYLASVGIRGEEIGPLLWPAVVLHAVITILLGRAYLTSPGRSIPASAEHR